MNVSNVPIEGRCTGCRACEQICGVQAITFGYNEFGFLQPIINERCTQCGLCLSVCPAKSMRSELFHNINQCYIAYAKNKRRALNSASGGAFIVIADRFLSRYKGIVYGCCMDEQFNVFHAGTDNAEELVRFQGSKYVQSNPENSYNSVKNELQKGRHVLYTGTPCQIAGLKMFLKRDWDNLYTVDLVCHGVPSQISFKKYIKYLEADIGEQIQSFRFRNRNIFDASGYLIKVKYKNGKTFKCEAGGDLYFRIFSKNMSLNKACYQCGYAQSERLGDITIGDSAAAGVLGIYRFEPKSSIMINSDKGEELWDLIKDDLIYTEIDKTVELERNRQLSAPSPCFENRDTVCRLMAEGKFGELNKQYPLDRKKHFDIHDITAKIPMVIKKPVFYVLSAVYRFIKNR